MRGRFRTVRRDEGFPPPTLDYPARCSTIADIPAIPPATMRSCEVLAGSVRVFAVSVSPASQQPPTLERVAALARAGIAHLEQVQAHLALAGSAAQPHPRINLTAQGDGRRP